MKGQNKFNAIFIIIVATLVGLACSGAVQTEEANKTVDQANKKLDEAKELYAATETRNTKLFDVNINTISQLQSYKASKSSEAKSIVSDYEKVSEMMKDVARQYDDISRMNLSEKYKDYARLKSDEYTKRAEAIAVRKGNAQAFMEIDDPSAMMTKFDENNSKSDRLFKDAEEIGAKAKKMEEENKELFRQA
jgi:predicted transcriptional regulator